MLSGHLRLDDAARREIIANYQRLLELTRSPILGVAAARASLFAQAESILDDVAGDCPRSPAVEPDSQPDLTDVGSSRAAQGVHPSASLDAAALLFEAALPVLLRESGDDGASKDGAAAIAVSLHHAIMLRVATAAIPYVNYLIKNLRVSHLNERQRVARELHDRAAHGIGLGLRHLELFRYYSGDDNLGGGDEQRAAGKLNAAEETLREALNLVRSLSAELRQTVGAVTLEEAIRAYLRANVPVTVHHRFTADGDSRKIPTEIGDELYLIARESIHNALRHAEMTEIHAQLKVAEAMVVFTMVDNGRGFDLDGALASPTGGGLLSMRERAELLGGELTLTSAQGHGTTITVAVPIALG